MNRIKFNQDEARQKAMNVFWQKGFKATTMRDLQSAMDLRPGSIYQTFGDKKALMASSLECYTQACVAFIEHLKTMPSDDALGQFLQHAPFQGEHASKVCFLVKTAAELGGVEGDDSKNLFALAQAGLLNIKEALTELITQGQAEGTLSTRHSAETLAQMVQVQLVGVMTFKQLGMPVSHLVDELAATLKA